MGKKHDIDELTTLLSKSLRHRIGSLVNSNDFYADRYAKDSEVLFREAEKVVAKRSWNKKDVLEVREILRKKLRKELEGKTFISNKKFDVMEKEMESVLTRILIF